MGFTIEDESDGKRQISHGIYSWKERLVQFYQLGIDDGRYGDHP